MDRLVDPPGAPEPVGDRSPTEGRGPLDTVSTDAVSTDAVSTDAVSTDAVSTDAVSTDAVSTNAVPTDDVESELYCSAREAGCGYVAIGALGAAPDDGLD
jgi:hypothetical protein